MKITLTLPPTDNHAYGQHGKIRFMKKEAKEWKETAGWIIKSMGIKKRSDDVEIGEIHFYLKFSRDIQGSLKLLFDAMEGIVYDNDKQIVKFGSVYKHKDKLKPRVEINL